MASAVPQYSPAVAEELQRLHASEEDMREISPALERLLDETALHGLSVYPWEHFRVLVATRLRQVIEARNKVSPLEGIEYRTNALVMRVLDLSGPPFTLQRMCELITQSGHRQYKSTESFLFAFDKAINVTSYQDQLTPEQFNTAAVELYNTITELKARPLVYEGLNRKADAFETTPSPADSPNEFMPQPIMDDPMQIDEGAGSESGAYIEENNGMDAKESNEGPMDVQSL